jgi:thiamine-phosphate pyrophosphorylase
MGGQVPHEQRRTQVFLEVAYEVALPSPLLYLITPLIDDSRDFAPTLRDALAAAPVSAVQLRLAPADERTLTKRVKEWAEIAQAAGAAAIVSVDIEPGSDLDLATVVMRGGADGLHVREIGQGRTWRERLKGERTVGIGNLRSRHDCMEAGEADLDYLMFGEPRLDDSIPAQDVALERASWWAEIFETPGVIYAPTMDDIENAVATGAEFVALRDAVFSHPDGAARGVAEAAERIARAEASTKGSAAAR